MDLTNGEKVGLLKEIFILYSRKSENAFSLILAFKWNLLVLSTKVIVISLIPTIQESFIQWLETGFNLLWITKKQNILQAV